MAIYYLIARSSRGPPMYPN